jgi:hypothetical protein
MSQLNTMFQASELFPPWFDWSVGNYWLKSALVQYVANSELPVFVQVKE